ncbi:MAG: hypothetical protein PHH60_01220 [Candidatus Margulisbacteria bacterium]|nr:hypothetical protein [Candidatus Margulisiibacteriota bacterium]
MKKIALLLVVVLLGTSAFAATTPPKRIYTPSVSSAPAASTDAGSAKKMGFGVQGLALTTNSITVPTLIYSFNEDMAGEFGLGFGSVSAGGASVSTFTFALGLRMNLGKAIGNLQPMWGGSIAYTSNPFCNNNTSNMRLTLNIGAEYFITPNFSFEGNLNPLIYNSFTAAGATTSTISALNSQAGVPAATFGMHIYL